MEELYQTLTNSGLTAPVTIPLRASLAARSRQEILSYLTGVYVVYISNLTLDVK